MNARLKEPGIEQVEPGKYRITVRIRINGKIIERREIVSGTKEKARDRRYFLKRELREGNPACSLTSTELRTFGDLLKIYKEKREHCSIAHLNKIRIVERKLGLFPLPHFSERFEQYMRMLKTTNSEKTGKPRSNASLNRPVEIVRAVFNMGVALGLLETNPIIRARFPKLKVHSRDVILHDNDRQRLLNIINKEAPHLSAIVRFALQVPCRKSELVNMKKEDLDLIHNAIRVKAENAKNDRGCWKPIPPDMVEYFRNLPNQTEYLFYREVEDKKTGELKYSGLGSFHSAWRRCRKLANLQGLHFHDTRHMAATALIDNGTPEQVVMTVANWKTNMLRTYYHREPKTALDLVRFSPDREDGVKTPKVSAL